MSVPDRRSYQRKHYHARFLSLREGRAFTRPGSCSFSCPRPREGCSTPLLPLGNRADLCHNGHQGQRRARISIAARSTGSKWHVLCESWSLAWGAQVAWQESGRGMYAGCSGWGTPHVVDKERERGGGEVAVTWTARDDHDETTMMFSAATLARAYPTPRRAPNAMCPIVLTHPF